MLLLEQTFDDDVRLAVWQMDETEEELWSSFHEQKEQYEEELRSVSNKHRRLELLTVRLLLLHLIHQEPIIEHDKEGRPFLKDCPLKISISHTNRYVAVIVSERHDVGIDIEMKKEKIFRVKHKILSPLEVIDVNRTLDSLLLHWCAKETIFKLSDISLPEFSEDIIVEPFKVNDEGTFQAYETKQNGSFLLHYRVIEDCVLVYAVR